MLLILPGAASGDTYYCSPTGTFPAAGTSEDPWPGLAWIFSASGLWAAGKSSGDPIQSGDTLRVMAGYYPAARIHVHALPDTLFIIGNEADSTDVMVQSINAESSTNIKFEKMAVGIGSAGTCFNVSDSGGSVSRNIYIYNCFIGKTTNYNTWTTTTMWGDSTDVKVGGSDFAGLNINFGNNIHVENCLVYANGYGIMAVGGTQHHIINNVFDGFCQDGYTAGASKGIVIQGNTFKNCVPSKPDAHNDAVQFYEFTNNTQDSIYVRNNKVLAWDTGGPIAGITEPQGITAFDSQVKNGVIENNLVVTTGWHGISINWGTNFIIRHNTVIDSDTTDVDGATSIVPYIRFTTGKVEFGSQPSAGIVANNIAPLFSITVDVDSIFTAANETASSPIPYVTDYNGLDYTIPATSPAINGADTTLSAVFGSYSNATDIVGAARGDARDIGAYEGSAPANVIYHHVNITGASGADGGDGTGSNPYEQVATAIAAADDGDIIRVRGTGAEKFTVDAAGITIKDYPGYAVPIFNGQLAFTGFGGGGGGGVVAVDSTNAVIDGSYTDPPTGASTIQRNLTEIEAGHYDIIGSFTAFFTIPISTANIDSFVTMVPHFTSYNNNDKEAPVRMYMFANTASPADTTSLQALLAARGDSITYTAPVLTDDTTYEMSDIAHLANQLILSGTGSDSLLIILHDPFGGDLIDYIGIKSIENETAPTNEVFITWSYQQTGTALPENIYAKAVGDTSWVTRMWNGNTLMTKLADGAVVDSNNEWCYSDGQDSVYVYLTTEADNENLVIDTAGPVATVTASRVTVRHLIIKNYSGFALKSTADTTKIYHFALDEVSKGVHFSEGTDGEFKNNAVAAVDTAVTDNGTSTDIDYNAYVTGYAQHAETHDIANAANWTTKYTVPPEAWRDLGVDVGLSYNGSAPEIGPMELDALVATGYVRRFLFKAGYKPPIFGDNRKTPIWSNQ
jgi:hypothetical protein